MVEPTKAPVVIIGAGLTGLSTALHVAKNDREAGVERSIVVIEREQRVGGTTSSHRRDGYTFDITGHWLHLRDDRIRALMGEIFSPGELQTIERRTGIYTHGVMLRYPFQANLYGLPLPIVQHCLVEFMRAQVEQTRHPSEPATFEEFAVTRFGRGIAEHFFIPYNRKLWGQHYDRLTPDKIARFVPMPDAAQVIGGAIGVRQEGLGYNASFLYPRGGGIDALPRALAQALAAFPQVVVRCGLEVLEVEPAARLVRLGDGSSQPYAQLISTMPLPQLIDRCTAVPSDVALARGQLRSLPWRYLDLATATPPRIDEHWIYVPEPHIPFFRVGIYSNALPSMAPPSKASLYVELADRQAPPNMSSICRHLVEMGALRSPSDVVFAQLRDIPIAYVVFDEHYPEATDVVHGWLTHHGIRSCGRYGGWIYNSMEESMLEGIDAATWVCQR